jgi:PAS domain S-box-containing protein
VRAAAAFARARAAGAPAPENEGLYQLLVESVRDYAIFALDPTGQILSWNAGAERIKGYRAEEIIGRHFSVFYPPEDLAAGKPALELVLAAQ